MKPSRRHIVHVIDSLARSGGSERQLLVNLQHFSRPELEHTLVVLRPGHDSRLGEVPATVPVSVLFSDEERPSRLLTTRRLLGELRRLQPDLIHCTLPESSYACRLVGPLLRTPVVESLVNISHEPIRATDNTNVSVAKLRAHAWLDRLTMRHFAGYHAVGQTVAESWSRVVGLPMDKIVVIPRGVPSDLLRREQRDRDRSRLAGLGVGDDSFVLLAVGRHEPQKGLRYAIEAMPSILGQIPDCHLVIAGRGGASTPQLRELVAALDLSTNVHLLGSRSDVPDLLAAADVFVFPSLYEGNGGNALIESMAAGCPVVVSNAPPMTEVADSDEVAVRVEPQDPSDLARAVIRMNDHAFRSRLSSAARQRVGELPTPLAVADGLEGWYMEVLEARASAG